MTHEVLQLLVQDILLLLLAVDLELPVPQVDTMWQVVVLVVH